MKKKFLDDMDMPASPAKKKSGSKQPPWLAKGDDSESEAEDDVLEEGMDDEAAPAEATDTEEPGSSASLADASDDELLAEMAKRGLSADGADDMSAEEEDEEDFA